MKTSYSIPKKQRFKKKNKQQNGNADKPKPAKQHKCCYGYGKAKWSDKTEVVEVSTKDKSGNTFKTSLYKISGVALPQEMGLWYNQTMHKVIRVQEGDNNSKNWDDIFNNISRTVTDAAKKEWNKVLTEHHPNTSTAPTVGQCTGWINYML